MTLENSRVWPRQWVSDGTVRTLVVQNVRAAQMGFPRCWDSSAVEWDRG